MCSHHCCYYCHYLSAFESPSPTGLYHSLQRVIIHRCCRDQPNRYKDRLGSEIYTRSVHWSYLIYLRCQTQVGYYQIYHSFVLPDADSPLSIGEGAAWDGGIVSGDQQLHLILQHFAFELAAANHIHSLKTKKIIIIEPKSRIGSIEVVIVTFNL